MAIDVTAVRSRRALLGGVAGAIAAVTAQALRPLTARAEGEVVHVGDTFDTAGSVTRLTNKRNDNHVFMAESTGDGTGVYGVSDGSYGVRGRSRRAFGVYGYSSGSHGVYAQSDGSGNGVNAFSRKGLGVYGSSGNSHGVYATSSGAAASLFASKHTSLHTVPDGNAIIGHIDIRTSPRTAIVGTTTGTGAGIRGSSEQGRGGLFGGPLANLGLIPSQASTHPASGARGDLLVDAGGRLWFCKGGTGWVQLA
jgi:hypothetical protein